MTISQDPDAPIAPSGWRIDDLAHRAGVTVDTIRYYQREGLLPPAERCGRTKLYGPEHLEQLERIKDLQARRFSLAAIRALLDESREGLLQGIFGEPTGGTATLDELVERSGIDPDLATEIRSSGLLRDPAEYGRAGYDELARLGLPPKALVELGRIYAEGIEATQAEVIGLFTTGGRVSWTDADELAEFQHVAGTVAQEILPRARRLVDYTHNRTIQRLTLDAIERGTVPQPSPPE